jgi:predicted transcriptional regulator
MKLEEVKEVLSAKILCGESLLHRDVEHFYASDLMSDILATVKEPGILITAMTQPQVVRTTQMLDLIGIIFVNGKTPPEETLKLARANEILIMTTKYSMFEACGKLYLALNRCERDR